MDRIDGVIRAAAWIVIPAALVLAIALAVGNVGAQGATATPTPAPASGDVHSKTSCTWIANSYTELWSAVKGGSHFGLLPPETVKDSLTNGITEDGEYLHDFRWYDMQGELVSDRGDKAVESYTETYMDVKNALDGRYLKMLVKFATDGSIAISIPFTSGDSGTGESWAYTGSFYSGGIGSSSTLQSTGCWHILPGSTPTGHEAFVVE